METPYGVRPGELTGTATFRLMPDDEPVAGASSLSASVVAAGRALEMAYTWTHPDDGEQAGLLLLGIPGPDRAVSAAWVDSWHQPFVTPLVGSASVSGARALYEYAPGWFWEIELEVSDARPTLVMRNVPPESEAGPDGAYQVTRTEWR
jgi:hypothetical protein